MLVLTRERNESIMIGDDVEVVIADVKGNKVRLGINAPREIAVHRKEIWLAIQAGIPRPDKTNTPHPVDEGNDIDGPGFCL